MYLQTYVLPKWEKYVGDTDLPEEIEEKYRIIAELMSNYLDNQKIRNSPPRLVTSWVNTHFAAENDDRELLINRLIAKQFSRFITNHRSQDQGSNFPTDELHTIIAIQQELDDERRSKLQRFTQIKAEVKRLRKERRRRRKAIARPKKIVSNPKTAKQSIVKSPSFDTIYSKWMEYVEDKQDTQNISKSYWYIHEYIARYIIKYAKENKLRVIDENTVQAFLDDYGKGKRPKTMNHYNRVAKYFLEFCLDLQKV